MRIGVNPSEIRVRNPDRLEGPKVCNVKAQAVESPRAQAWGMEPAIARAL